jgi:hypothetical protein
MTNHFTDGGATFDPMGASVQYDLWRGSVALDTPDQLSRLEDALGIEGDQWQIVGLHIAGGRIGAGELTSLVTVYVVPTAAGLKFDDITAAREVDVTEIEVTTEGVALELLQTVFKRWSIHAVPRGFIERGVRFNVIETIEPEDADD